jgi:hypothetical protein
MKGRTMDVSELRKRIIRALDDARKDASNRRVVVDEAAKAYETFLTEIATPVMRQAALVLKAENHPFTVQTPAGTVRLVSDSASQTFIEFALDTSGTQAAVIGRVSLARGRQGHLIEERPIADKPVASLLEEDLSAFLIAEIPKLIVRS